jgi:polyhydroxyalkanoate synthesis regulator phasin
MEADEQTQQGGNNTTTQQSGGNNAPKASVTFNDAQNQVIKATARMRVSQLIQRFIQWINDAMSKFSDKFNKNHEREVKWIKDNMKLNEEIARAIQQGKFKPNVANFPIFKIPAAKLSAIKIADQVKKYSDPKVNFDSNEFMAICVSSDQSIVNELKKVNDPDKLKEMWTNYILYSQLEAPKLYTGELSADQWKDLYTDLTQTQNLLSSIVKANSEDLRNASKSLQQQAQQLETAANNNESQEATAKRERINALNKCVQDIAKIYESTTLNVLNAKFYKTSYNMYRDIVAGYKQQNNSTQPQQQTTQQGQQPQTTNNNNADQPALDASSNAN